MKVLSETKGVLYMQINQLIHFVTIVNEQSFTTAANELHIAQPSLSASIKRLENEIGFTLIDRSSRVFKLTAEGRSFFDEANKFVMHHGQVMDTAENLKTKGINHISISLIESVKSWLPKIVKAYKEINTDTRIKIDHALSIAEIEKSFNDYDVNLAITNQFIENDKIISIPLYEESLIVALPKDNQFSGQSEVTLKDIAGLPLIISHDGYQTRTEIVRAFNRIGLQANIGFEIERFELTSEFIKQGLGIAILPEKYALTLDKRDVDIKDISDLPFYRIVYISIDKTRFLSPLTESFINLVLAYFNKGKVQDYFN